MVFIKVKRKGLPTKELKDRHFLLENLREIRSEFADIYLNDINNTHTEKLSYEGFTQFSTRNGWLAASDLFHMFTYQLSSIHSIITYKSTDV